MAIIRCSKGHYYDDEKYSECPMCKNASSHSDDDEKTVDLFSSNYSDDERTIGIFAKKTKCDPVVGWLVCVSGPDKGRDYRIHSGRNFIGRAFNNDISLPGDSSISRNNEGYIIYEPHKNNFIIMNGEGTNIHINGKVLMEPHVLEETDKITVGSYEFDFVAYCKGENKW